MDKPRHLFEPTGVFERILYAIMAFLLPYSIMTTWFVPDLDFARPVLMAWWLIATIYTIREAVMLYRRWRDRSTEDVGTLP